MMRAAAAGVVLAAGLLLAACAAGPERLPADEPRAIATASDQTDVDRRAQVRLELASAYFGRGQLDTALDEVKQALAINPQSADAYGLRALIYGAMGESRLAEDSYRRALAINPRDGGLLHNQGWFYCQQNRQAEAQARFAEALAQPQYRDVARTQLARGICFGRDSRWTEAEGALMRAYELDPANPAVGINLAEVLYRRGELERARFYVGRLNDNPALVNAQTLWLAARIEHKAGRIQPARRLGDQLRSRHPQSPEAALYERGQFDD
ncbi:type IV pilus biogenesis/stability protein PilW [Aquabacterium sp. OR-4]|uniref:type IV pilus biogenesis/stability protein PilW n=1 Tax=Aquabacterium sp. OR-4 TaxID=2978127 RepID=UPI0021B39D97|nr:type IV pilus biogenesis/stability protein PilW [Aquabacterium sp. OR-4]MDT7835481.1 type IV pilus biogenesis/stability protein PilW [Aquabacterium sp. OR-4]